MNKDELDKILELHKKWLNDEPDGKEANLSNADLSNANLFNANLRFADLSFADLSNANLSNADLRFAHLNNADLRFANLYLANLRHSDLHNSDLRFADLSNANLCNAKLSGAKLDGVIYDESTAFFALQCPEEGSFVGWKKCLDDTIVKLLIPEDAKRSSATTRKCRCDKARVLEIWDENGEPIQKARSSRSPNFVYRVGETVSVPDFDEDRRHECAPGIHFFITRREAELYD